MITIKHTNTGKTLIFTEGEGELLRNVLAKAVYSFSLVEKYPYMFKDKDVNILEHIFKALDKDYSQLELHSSNDVKLIKNAINATISFLMIDEFELLTNFSICQAENVYLKLSKIK